jgi:hypothetical protein
MSLFTANVLHGDIKHVDHEHMWVTESTHPTSEGRVMYMRCDACGLRQVNLQPVGTLPETAVSRTIGAAANSSAGSETIEAG